MSHTSDGHERSVERKARIGTALSAVAVLFLLFDSTGKLLKVAPVVAVYSAARVSRGHHSHARCNPDAVHRYLRSAAFIDRGCRPADRLPGWCGGHACAGREPTADARPVPGLRRSLPLGWPAAPRCAIEPPARGASMTTAVAVEG